MASRNRSNNSTGRKKCLSNLLICVMEVHWLEPTNSLRHLWPGSAIKASTRLVDLSNNVMAISYVSWFQHLMLILLQTDHGCTITSWKNVCYNTSAVCNLTYGPTALAEWPKPIWPENPVQIIRTGDSRPVGFTFFCEQMLLGVSYVKKVSVTVIQTLELPRAYFSMIGMQ